MKQLPILFDARAADARIAGQRRKLIWQLVSVTLTTIGLLICLGASIFAPQWVEEHVWVQAMQWVLGITAVTGLLTLLANLLWMRQLRAGRREIGQGLAMVLSHDGIETEKGAWRWEDMQAVQALPGKVGHGYRLAIIPSQGPGVQLPLEALTLMPGSLDSAARAYSAGRHGVDLRALDD